MAVISTSRSVTIYAPTFEREPIKSQVPNMSMELAVWLTHKLGVVESRRADGYMLEARLMAFHSPKTHNWNQRCKLAASRTYSPELADSDGELTPFGLTTAEQLREMFMSADREEFERGIRVTSWDTDNDVTTILSTTKAQESEFWTKAEHCFLSGSLSVRQLKMLEMLLKATEEAEQLNREELDEKFRSVKTAEAPDPDDLENIGVIRPNQIANMIVDIGTQREAMNTPQAFQAKMFDIHSSTQMSVEMNQELERAPLRLAFVPTAMFGQKARNDLVQLERYGLVDLKAYITGHRGRPKHMVRVSTTGEITVRDLRRLGVL